MKVQEGEISLNNIWQAFPVLAREDVHYLDSGSSAQKPDAVIETINHYMGVCYANVHRGTYHLSESMTSSYEQARGVVANFLGALPDEIVWQNNATAGINLVARSYGGKVMSSDKAIVISQMEHHANIVPWQMLSEERGNPLRVIAICEDGSLDMEHYGELLSGGGVGLVAISHMSNVLGTVNDIKKIVQMAHEAGAKVLVDGSQGAVHQAVDVKALDCDFYVCTGHKLYGPTGIGVLYGKAELLATMPPVNGGGDMIDKVSFTGTTFAKPPARFESGTPPIVQAIGLGSAITWLTGLGWQAITMREQTLGAYLARELRNLSGVHLYGEAPEKGGIWAFNLEGLHHHDVSVMLDDLVKVAVRSGHHCAQPLMEYYGVQGMVRASLGIYNREEDIDCLIEGLHRILKIRKRKSV